MRRLITRNIRRDLNEGVEADARLFGEILHPAERLVSLLQFLGRKDFPL
jgi:hypothetical protein